MRARAHTHTQTVEPLNDLQVQHNFSLRTGIFIILSVPIYEYHFLKILFNFMKLKEISMFSMQKSCPFLLSLFLHLKICILFFICCWYTEMHLAFITHTHPSSSLNSFPNSNNLLWIILSFLYK